MPGELLAHLRNWFVVQNGVHKGEYTITGGVLILPFLVAGQYYRIIGSVFNDGVYKYNDASGSEASAGGIAGDSSVTLTDETFTGEVWALAVPPEVVALAAEISAWKTANPESVKTSESFGGYSYTRASGENGALLLWQGVFRARLNRWRKA